MKKPDWKNVTELKENDRFSFSERNNRVYVVDTIQVSGKHITILYTGYWRGQLTGFSMQFKLSDKLIYKGTGTPKNWSDKTS